MFPSFFHMPFMFFYLIYMLLNEAYTRYGKPTFIEIFKINVIRSVINMYAYIHVDSKEMDYLVSSVFEIPCLKAYA